MHDQATFMSRYSVYPGAWLQRIAVCPIHADLAQERRSCCSYSIVGSDDREVSDHGAAFGASNVNHLI